MPIVTIQDERYLDQMIARVRSFVSGHLSGGSVEIEVKRESKNRAQESKYHSMIGDIAKTVEFNGRSYTPKVWKAMLIDDFEQELIANGESLSKPAQTVVSMDGRRAVTIRPTTTEFRKKEASDFIQFLYMKGGELDAVFTDKSLEYYEEIMRGRV